MDGKATMTLGLALIGAGRIGSHHAGIVAHRVPGARLVAVADPRPGRRRAPRRELGADAVRRPDRCSMPTDVDAVVIAAASTAHAELVAAAAAAGKAVFCEKPMAMTLADADRAIAAGRGGRASRCRSASTAASRRDFAAAHELIAAGAHRHAAAAALADPRPGLADPGARPAVDDLPRRP